VRAGGGLELCPYGGDRRGEQRARYDRIGDFAVHMKHDFPPLDRWRVDAVLEPERKIWGLPQIAEVLGVSVDKARALARLPEVPIYRPAGSGSYFAFRSELLAWLRRKP